MLGRPYAIDDAVIDIEVPSHFSPEPFSHLIRMGRITSEMHVAVFYPEPEREESWNQAKSGNLSSLMSTLRSFHDRLKLWRLQVPVFEHQTCAYETPEFFEMTFQESRLWLFRAAINNLPAGSTVFRDKLLLLCLQAAQQVIKCFNNLWLRGLATCSRSSTRLILISGLVTISIFKMQIIQRPRCSEEDDVSVVDIDFWLEDLGLDSPSRYPTNPAFRETIGTARRILSGLAVQMPDVVAYAHFFEILEGEVETFHQGTSSSNRGAREVANDDSSRNDGTVLDPEMMVSVLSAPHPQQYSSQAVVQQNGDLNQLNMGLGGTALDNLLSNMYQGDQLSNNNDGVLLGNDPFWSFPHAPWMEEIDGDISGFIWDTAMPWQGSPANT